MLRDRYRILALGAAFAVGLTGYAATASAHDSDWSYWGGYYGYSDPMAGHIQRERRHMWRERRHMWREQRARDEMYRRGDWWGAWNMQRHLNDEGRHLRSEQEHVGHELFWHDPW